MQVDSTTLDDAFGHWLAGFIDGEGCFRIHSQKRGVYYAPTFSLKLRDDDTALLNEIVARTGIGRVRRDGVRSGNSNPCVVWRIDSRKGTEALAVLLDRYPLRSRKARDYAVWRRAVDVRGRLPRGNRWRGAKDWTPLIELKHEIEQAREYVPDGKGVLPRGRRLENPPWRLFGGDGEDGRIVR